MQHKVNIISQHKEIFMSRAVLATVIYMYLGHAVIIINESNMYWNMFVSYSLKKVLNDNDVISTNNLLLKLLLPVPINETNMEQI